MPFQLPQSTTPLFPSTVLVLPPSEWGSVVEALKAQGHPADCWQPNDPEVAVTMAELRQLQQFAHQQPVSGSKLAIITGADQLKAETANALLKLLEEPPAYLTLVLLAESERLLPTIRSRVQIVRWSGAETESSSKRGQWQRLLLQFDSAKKNERAQTKQLLYRGALLHPTIQQEIIEDAFTPPSHRS